MTVETKTNTTVFRNAEKLDNAGVIERFKKALSKVEFSKSEIEELSDIYAKNMVDKFIVSDGALEGTFGRQGDILFWKKGSDMYEQEIKGVTKGNKTDRMVLQDGDSMTGDHRIVPLKGSKYTIYEGKLTPSFLKGKDGIYDFNKVTCRLLKIDKPFLVVHREHGNMAYPAGEYMICPQLDCETLDRMRD